MVELQDQRVLYQGNGSTTEFPFYFTIEEGYQVAVLTSTTAGRSETELVLGTDYTVTLNEDGTGTVVLTEPLADGTALALVSNIEETQQRTFPDNTPYYQEQVEGGIDKNCRLIQQILEVLDRCVKVSATSSMTPEELLDDLYTARDVAVEAQSRIEQLIAYLEGLLDDVKTYGLEGDGITIKSINGKWTLMPATADHLGGVIITGTDGLVIDEDGVLSVDFSQMPEDVFNEMLKVLTIPIFLTANKYWYVDGTNGSDDTSTEGRGESVSLPFKTIQACVDYVTTYYNMSSYTSVIYILPGTYTESVELGSFSTSTGSCRLRAYSDDYDTIIVNDGEYTINCTGGTWYLDRLVIRNVFANPGDGGYYYPSAARATDGGALYVVGCKVYQSFSGSAPSSGDIQCRTIAAYSNGIIYLDASSYSYRTIEVHVNNATSLQVLYCERQGQIQGNGASTSQAYSTFACSGECTYFCHLNDRGTYIQLGGSTYHTQFTDSGMTGQKYLLKKMSLCSLLEDGEDYFPGDTAGVVDADSFAYYGA